MPRQLAGPVTAESPRTAPGRRQRRGLTLVELLAVIVIFGIVAGSIMTLFVRQQRYYAGASEVIDVRGQVREAVSLLPIDLRGTSSSGGDIMFNSDSAIEFRATYGTAVVCDTNSLARTFYVLPTVLSRQLLTSWYAPPEVGDTMFVFDENTTSGAQDDRWIRYRISALSSNDVTHCLGAPYADPVNDAPALPGKARWAFTTDSAVPSSIIPGSVIRFTRRVRYSLYQSPTDNLWYLGYRRGDAAIQPVSGPYRAYSTATGQSGVTFAYYDSLGNVLANTAVGRRSVARIDITVRGQGQLRPNFAGNLRGAFTDSLKIQIALRNRQ